MEKKIFILTLTLFILFSCTENPDTRDRVKYDDSWESLEQYRCPEWFRDAKFGIWSHWNATCVPGASGGWYGREMYMEGSNDYKLHLKKYGHPSEVGYKDVVELWKAENFDPEKLIALYKECGAKYFVSLAVHHDNFDLWNSKHHQWNSVNNGPRKNITAMWEEAARKAGLHWGLTSHLERSWNWFQTSHGADTSGVYAGVPYDGNNPDLSYIYHDTYGIRDNGYAYSLNFPPQWIQEYTLRIKDLLEQHKPDLFYMDGAIPFGQKGRELIAWYYNNYRDWTGRNEDPVMALKNYGVSIYHGDFRYGTCVEDVEAGRLGEISREPWQTDTSIGSWFWVEGEKYISAKEFADQLIDIVSKNGNLLMNIPLRPDGTPEPRAVDLLKEIGKWLRTNGEGIYGTRPYIVFGEGITKDEGGHFTRMKELTASDFRFTTKGDTLFTFVCGQPVGEVSVRALSKGYYHNIKTVSMLGVEGSLPFRQEAGGLKVAIPPKLPSDFAVCLKIIPDINSEGGR